MKVKRKQPRRPRFVYENETDVHVSKGSVAVANDITWLGEVMVAVGGERAVIQVERRPEDAAPSDATLAVRFDEVDAVLTLLTGVVDQARRSGVLPERESAARAESAAER
jgi:hypothetical protein